MQVNPAYAATSPPPGSTLASAAGAGLGTNQFMQMLMAQITNQNPLEPMKDGEMMSQMAQLNSLQELQTLNSLLQRLSVSNTIGYAASLIGKNVRAERSDGSTLEGKVTGVTFSDGQAVLLLDEERLPLDAVLEISGGEA